MFDLGPGFLSLGLRYEVVAKYCHMWWNQGFSAGFMVLWQFIQWFPGLKEH